MNNAYSVYSKLGHLFLETDFSKRAADSREAREAAKRQMRSNAGPDGKSKPGRTNLRKWGQDVTHREAGETFRNNQKPNKISNNG